MECKVCGHKHKVWDGEDLILKHEDTEEFLRIEGKFEYVKDLNWKETTLYAYPKCMTVQITR